MVASRTCSFRKQGGEQCRNGAMEDDEQCFWHSPAHADEAAAARKLGGQHRRREHSVAGAFGIEGVTTIPQLQRIIEVVVFEGLAMQNSNERGRLLISAVMAAAKLLEAGELADKLAAINGVLEARLPATKRRR
jgi:hypothetical protein